MASCSRNYFGKLQGMKLPPNTYVHIESNESKRMTVAMYQDQNSKTKICTTSKTHTSVNSFRNDYSRSLSHCCSFLQQIWYLMYKKATKGFGTQFQHKPAYKFCYQHNRYQYTSSAWSQVLPLHIIVAPLAEIPVPVKMP